MSRRLARKLLDYDLEIPRLREVFSTWITAGITPKVLDVGCGFGRNLTLLRELGCDVKGVEVNQICIDELRGRGFDCVRPEDLGVGKQEFDIVLMAHVIEHFAPEPLLHMMDEYLEHLKPGGRLVVLTPLLSPYFYDDFDHVKPYHPAGLLMVFGRSATQVQYRSRNRLELEDIWFRRTHYKPAHVRSVLMGQPVRLLSTALELVSVILFHLSANLIGRKDGWMGVFRKLEAEPNKNSAGVAR